jgi:hypothetical protein
MRPDMLISASKLSTTLAGRLSATPLLAFHQFFAISGFLPGMAFFLGWLFI